ncbi:E3 Ubiquitin-Protein Ligase Ubr3 [Manis pentadactyla]|nr:E3 Ubiquitin-Protein Ligase Ubr3 [Manis pentadactyla]
MEWGGASSDTEDLAASVTHGPAWGAVCLVCAALGSKFEALLPAPLLFLGDSQKPRPSGTSRDHPVRTFEEVPIHPGDMF